MYENLRTRKAHRCPTHKEIVWSFLLCNTYGIYNDDKIIISKVEKWKLNLITTKNQPWGDCLMLCLVLKDDRKGKKILWKIIVWMMWKIPWKKHIKENANENIIIFSPLLFLKNNEENRREIERKSWGKFYRAPYIVFTKFLVRITSYQLLWLLIAIGPFNNHHHNSEHLLVKNLKKNMKNLKTKYGGTPQFILWYLPLQWMKA